MLGLMSDVMEVGPPQLESIPTYTVSEFWFPKTVVAIIWLSITRQRETKRMMTAKTNQRNSKRITKTNSRTTNTYVN